MIYGGLIVALLVGVGVLFSRVCALNESRRMTNQTIANSIHVPWRLAHDHLTDALARLEHPERGSPTSALELAEQELRAAVPASRIYGTTLNYGLTNLHVSFEFISLMTMYAQEVGGIRRQVQSDGSLRPELILAKLPGAASSLPPHGAAW